MKNGGIMEKVIPFSLENGVFGVKVENPPRIDIFKTFDCGQCFRFDPVSLFGHKHEFGGVAFGRYVVFGQDTESDLYIYNSTLEDYEKIWRNFLAFDVDYGIVDSHISTALKSEHMDRAIECSRGIRILRQDGWEAVCSFIISQNNNIPRIKKIISSLCQNYGGRVCFLGQTYYTFPKSKALLEAGEEAIFALKTGFRAKYIIDACQAIFESRISLDEIKETSDFDACVAHLCRVKGIGLKVACCALLFGFDKTEAFPIDVWMKRALERYFPEGIDLVALGKWAGIAQQYLFYYEKYVQNT